MSTMVRIKSGQTVGIGGLITRNQASRVVGVPFLCRIPVIGKAFSWESRNNNRTELVVFLTPRKV